MPAEVEGRILEAAGLFRLVGAAVEAVPWGSGHINETFVVATGVELMAAADHGDPDRRRYVLQRINQEVFPDPEALMGNIVLVTEHLRRKLEEAGVADPRRRVLSVVPAADGRPYAWDDAGDLWRAYDFIEGTRTHDVAPSPPLAYEVARAFGSFQAQLADLPPRRLAETIPRFHDTPHRLAQLRAALADDPVGRAEGVALEVDRVEAHADLAGALTTLQRSGDLPERVTHNDTKINNVLIDEDSGEGLCVIDLDTVMPGLVPYDFGDLVRTAASPAAEDEPDLSKVRLDLPTFEALVRGYLSGAADFLTPAERRSLALSGRVITYEMALRFLTDHLRGDTYFRIHRPGHNLDRARVQLELLAQLDRRAAELEEIVWTAAS